MRKFHGVQCVNLEHRVVSVECPPFIKLCSQNHEPPPAFYLMSSCAALSLFSTSYQTCHLNCIVLYTEIKRFRKRSNKPPPSLPSCPPPLISLPPPLSNKDWDWIKMAARLRFGASMCCRASRSLIRGSTQSRRLLINTERALTSYRKYEVGEMVR